MRSFSRIHTHANQVDNENNMLGMFHGASPFVVDEKDNTRVPYSVHPQTSEVQLLQRKFPPRPCRLPSLPRRKTGKRASDSASQPRLINQSPKTRRIGTHTVRAMGVAAVIGSDASAKNLKLSCRTRRKAMTYMFALSSPCACTSTEEP